MKLSEKERREMFKMAYGDIPKDVNKKIIEVSNKVSKLQNELDELFIPFKLCASRKTSLFERYPKETQHYFRDTMDVFFSSHKEF